MSNTVPAAFKPSGAIVTPDPMATLETFLAEHRVQLVVDEHHRLDGFDFGSHNGRTSVITAPGFDPAYILAKVKPMIADWEAHKVPFEQASSDGRTFTYPLLRGGSLTATCPDWCVSDHSHDLRLSGIHPSDLQHVTEAASLVFDVCSGPIGTLEARIVQDPFGSDGAEKPCVVFCPIEGDEPVTPQYLSAHQFGQAIDQVQAHVDRLRKMQERLAQISADEHARYFQRLEDAGNTSSSGSWEGLRAEDVKSMPVAYLLQVFGAKVVEVDGKDFPDERVGSLKGQPGELTVQLLRTLPQAERESVVRELLGRFTYEARFAAEAQA